MTYSAHNRYMKGSVAVYTVLLVLIVMLSSALVISGVMIRQIRAAHEIVASERAFFAANTGIERAMYFLRDNVDMWDEVNELEDEIQYNDRTDAGYEVTFTTKEEDGRRIPCIRSEGSVGSTTRTVVFGELPDDCQ